MLHTLQIEFSNMATQSKQIVKDNNLEDVIEVIHGKVEDVKELPDGIEKVLSIWIIEISRDFSLLLNFCPFVCTASLQLLWTKDVCINFLPRSYLLIMIGWCYYIRMDGLLFILRIDVEYSDLCSW